MINGKFWPIDDKKITDGYSLSLKNAKKLLVVAQEQFDKETPDYALCIFLAASAIEETGKGILLLSLLMKNQKIDAKKWEKKFENHEVKITAAVNHIREFVKKGDKKRHKALDELRSELLEILEQKFASIYIDWDATKNDWAFFDEMSKTEKKQQAKRVLKNANWIIDGYLKDGKLITERTKVIWEMVRVGLAVGECKNCSFISNNLQEIASHNKEPNHQIGFRET